MRYFTGKLLKARALRCSFLLMLLSSGAQAATRTDCGAARQLHLPSVRIESADAIMAGTRPEFLQEALPGASRVAMAPNDFCRVSARANPGVDSDIRFELWVPLGAAWNGKFQQVGNGGFAGSIPYPAMWDAVRRGYAVAGTDDGHRGATIDATWAIGHPERITDFGWRAVKQTTDASQRILAAVSGARPRRSYFVGCSDGGREALMVAQRFPADFDGIIAGAPANNWTRLQAEAALLEKSYDPQSDLPDSKLPLLQQAVLRTCAGGNAYLTDPRDCHFSPESLQCSGAGNRSDCLTRPEVATARQIYEGFTNPGDGEQLPGLEPGAEAQPGSWSTWLLGPSAQDRPRGLGYYFALGFFGAFVRQDPNFRLADLTEADILKGERQLAPILDAVATDLSTFKAHGGKIIQFHGWNDPAISPLFSLDYYSAVRAKMGSVDDFYRLFMVPGMLHCQGGAAPDQVDWLGALEAWVEHGKPPNRLDAKDSQGNRQTLQPFEAMNRASGSVQ